MGFFQGVVAQLNTIDERNERFAKEERDRAERRKELQANLKEKRMQNLLTVAAKRGITGGLPTSAVKPGSGGLPTDITPSPSTGALKGHFTKILLNDMKASPEALAPFAALGESNMEEIFDAVNTVRKTYQDSGREAEFTPDVVNNILKGVRVTVEAGGTVKYDDLLEMAGLTDLTEEERKYLDLMLQRGPSAKVTILGSKPQFPMGIEDIKRVKDAASSDLTVTLRSLEMDLQTKVQQGTATPTENSELSKVSRAIEQIESNDGNIPNWVIKDFGATVLAPYIQNEPRILRGNLGGAWDMAKSKVFATEEQLKAAFKAGTVKIGDTVSVGGRAFILNN